MAPPPRPKPGARPNPIRQQRVIRPPSSLGKGKSSARSAKRACPNKECLNPSINEEGTCTNCGTIVTESNIVSEVSFGENSSGAAVMQGQWVGENQGVARSDGPGFGNNMGSGGQSRRLTQDEGQFERFNDHLSPSN